MNLGDSDDGEELGHMHSNCYHVDDVTLPNGHIMHGVPGYYSIESISYVGRCYKKERAVVNTMRKLWLANWR
jgi:hypothetical protein